MGLKYVAVKIPEIVRSELLKNNVIGKAEVNSGDKNMLLLLDIWHDYIEPHKEKTTCPYCMDNILTNFKQMLPDLVELENEYLKFNSL